MELKTKISQLKKGDRIFLVHDEAESGTKCSHTVQSFDGRLAFQPTYICYWLDQYNEDMTHKRDSRMDILCGWEAEGEADMDIKNIWKGDNFYEDRAEMKKYLVQYL